MTTYRTSQVAKIIGIHANTVRFYEEQHFISTLEREPNGYRIFTDKHIGEFKLARVAFKSELLQNGLRKKAILIVTLTASSQYEEATQVTKDYIQQIEIDRTSAEEALTITKKILQRTGDSTNQALNYKRSEVATLLNVSIDTLRNWELNGLFEIKRKENGYRMYTESDLEYLKIIKTLRHANYSLSAILTMLLKLSSNAEIDIREALNVSEKIDEDDIIKACDQLLFSLDEAKQNAHYILKQLDKLKELNPPV